MRMTGPFILKRIQKNTDPGLLEMQINNKTSMSEHQSQTKYQHSIYHEIINTSFKFNISISECNQYLIDFSNSEK